MTKPVAAFILPEHNRQRIYNQATQERIAELTEVIEPTIEPKDLDQRLPELKHLNFIFTGWGAPRLTEEILLQLPELKAVFYGAGSIRGMVSDAFWQRRIPVCSAWRANAVPVAEFTVAQVILGLKLAHRYALRTKQRNYKRELPIRGTYGATVGLIGLGAIGRLVARYLKPFEFNVIAYDPFVSEEIVRELGVQMVGTLDTIFQESDVVSLHAPNIEANRRMLRKHHFESMRPWSTFINTARGAIIHEEEMIEVLRDRNDLTAILDVTYPEPPEPDSPLFELENVVLTPHIAGSQGLECHRMGAYMLAELERFLNHEPLQHQVTREMFEHMA